MNSPVDRMKQETEVWWSNLWPVWENPPQSAWVTMIVILAIIAALSPWLWRVLSSLIDLGDFFFGCMFGTNSHDTSQRASRKKS